MLTAPGLCGSPADHIRLLHDADATSQVILDGLAWLDGQAAADGDATAEQPPFLDAATEDFPVALLRGGKELPGR
ncbi:MAG: hypothetical protein KatS3mg053_1184 [Candidatus Roseilinea sp.]|nr:MAG: hypothetical protein KatS3mg053_1184 [Candidatus Roseilinea sp.]